MVAVKKKKLHRSNLIKFTYHGIFNELVILYMIYVSLNHTTNPSTSKCLGDIVKTCVLGELRESLQVFGTIFFFFLRLHFIFCFFLCLKYIIFNLHKQNNGVDTVFCLHFLSLKKQFLEID